jgi:hypothetical protein
MVENNAKITAKQILMAAALAGLRRLAWFMGLLSLANLVVLSLE